METHPKQTNPSEAIDSVLSCVPKTPTAFGYFNDPLFACPILGALIELYPSQAEGHLRLFKKGRKTYSSIVQGEKGKRNDLRGNKSVVGLFMLAGAVASEGATDICEKAIHAAAKIQKCFSAHIFLVERLREMSSPHKEAIRRWFHDWIICKNGQDQASWSEILRGLIANRGVCERLYAGQFRQYSKLLDADSDVRNEGKRAVADVARTHRMALIVGSSEV